MSICTRCQAVFACGMVDAAPSGAGAEPCWCTKLPVLAGVGLPSPDAAPATCFCPDCLRRLTEGQVAGQAGSTGSPASTA